MTAISFGQPEGRALQMAAKISIRTADATPHAASLIESLRDIGYSTETALADIVDNAITASARRVEILSETSIEEPKFAILDDGEGMTEFQLVEAMRPGSRNPLDDRKPGDLGRFGLGLKSASFSQCRHLTVLSRRDGVTSGVAWDLDELAQSGKWRVAVLDDFAAVPWSDRISERGTLVVWQKMDRMIGGARNNSKKRIEHLNRLLSVAERHLRLVFHRFMEEKPGPLAIRINGRQLEPIDPFASRHPACQAGHDEPMDLDTGVVAIKSYTLPHHKEMTMAQWDEIGGPDGHLRSQGFYVYRERRLIIQGGWLGLARQTELTKLCRVRIDIPNTMDAEWKIDVKKASAQLPPTVRERLKSIVERFSITSKQTYQRRGRKLVDDRFMPMWNRVVKDGCIVYRVDANHPALKEFETKLAPGLRPNFNNCIGLISASLPIDALQVDMAGNSEDVRADAADSEAIKQALGVLMPILMKQRLKRERIVSLLRSIDPFRDGWSISISVIDELLAGYDEDA